MLIFLRNLSAICGPAGLGINGGLRFRWSALAALQPMLTEFDVQLRPNMLESLRLMGPIVLGMVAILFSRVYRETRYRPLDLRLSPSASQTIA